MKSTYTWAVYCEQLNNILLTWLCVLHFHLKTPFFQTFALQQRLEMTYHRTATYNCSVFRLMIQSHPHGSRSKPDRHSTNIYPMQRPTFVALRCLSHTLVGEAYSLQRNLWYFYPQPTVSINAKLPCLSIATYTGNVCPFLSCHSCAGMQPVDESYYTPMRTHASFVNLNIVLVPSQSLHWFQVQMGGFWQVPSPPSKWERNCVWAFEIMLLKHLFLCLLSLLMACWHCSCEANRSGRMLVNEIRTQAAASATTVPRRKRTTSGAQIMNTNNTEAERKQQPTFGTCNKSCTLSSCTVSVGA